MINVPGLEFHSYQDNKSVIYGSCGFKKSASEEVDCNPQIFTLKKYTGFKSATSSFVFVAPKIRRFAVDAEA